MIFQNGLPTTITYITTAVTGYFPKSLTIILFLLPALIILLAHHAGNA